MIVFGEICLDLFFPLDRLPGPSDAVVLPAVQIQSGGAAATQAVAAARDGGSVILAGAVGEDAFAAQALAGPAEAGVDLRRVQPVRGFATGLTTAWALQAKHVHLVTASGANMQARDSQVETALLTPHALLLLQTGVGPEDVSRLALRAAARGTGIVISFRPPREIALEALRAARVLLLDIAASGWLSDRLGTGVGAGSLRAALGCIVVRTMGTMGVEYADETGVHRVPAFSHVVVEEAGTADCFAGVFAAALERGLALRPALERASVAAALSAGRAGAQISLPTRDEIDAAILQDMRDRLKKARS